MLLKRMFRRLIAAARNGRWLQYVTVRADLWRSTERRNVLDGYANTAAL